MLSPLPDFADPKRLCALGKAYEGAIPLADLPRLAPLLTSAEGEAAFVLAFGTDAERRPTVRVQVQASLPVQCQRCLGSMALAVDADARLAVVSGPEEAERLPDGLDPLLVEDEQLELRSLIEDELILAIPQAPTHAPDDCALRLGDGDTWPVGGKPVLDDRPVHPFAALAGWKGDPDKHD